MVVGGAATTSSGAAAGAAAVPFAAATRWPPTPPITSAAAAATAIGHQLRRLRRMLTGTVDPMLVEHLARAAVARVPYAELRRISRRPWQDLELGRHHDLAGAELRRLGLRVPDWSDPATDPGLPRAQPGARHG